MKSPVFEAALEMAKFFIGLFFFILFGLIVLGAVFSLIGALHG